jgi:microcystin degradation protein MlrC
MKRVGIIALLHESNTFLDEPTTLAHFESDVLCAGADVLDAFRRAQHEVGGFIEALEASPDMQPVGVFAARAVPYGPITTKCWETLLSRMRRELQAAGPLDGVLVAPHGAAVAEQVSNADGDWLTRIRREIGAARPMIGTLDLHANVSPQMVTACDALLGYRTNPHLDQRARGLEAGQLIVRTLRGEIVPTSALVQLPLCVNIERQSTSEPHGGRLWAEADRLAHDDQRVLSISCLYGFPYADVPEMGASVIAVVDRDAQLARHTAQRLALYWWQMRHEFLGHLISVDDAIALACREREQDRTRPVGLLDMGDNVGGGSAGDGTILVQAWLRSGCGSIFAILYDPAAVQAAQRVGVGSRWRVSVGGKTDDRHGGPIEDEFTVVQIGDGKFCETEPRHGGYSHFDQGPTAILRSDAGLTVMATSRRVGPMSLQQLLSQGVDPGQYAAIVIKGVHAPVAAYTPVCSRLIRVNTPGSTCADLGQFSFQRRRRPMVPFESVTAWDVEEQMVDPAGDDAWVK